MRNSGPVEIEIDGEKYAVVFEENSTKGGVDAVVADYEDRVFLDNDREQAGTSYLLKESEVANADPLEVVRDRVLDSKTGKNSDLEMDGIEAL